jgi:hypothetical protein
MCLELELLNVTTKLRETLRITTLRRNTKAYFYLMFINNSEQQSEMNNTLVLKIVKKFLQLF